MERDGKRVGSALIAPMFTSAGHFHGRPAATTAPESTDPARPCGDLQRGKFRGERISRARGIEKLRQENPLAQVPDDLVSISGSRFDPHPTPEAALFRRPGLQRPAACLKFGCGSLPRQTPATASPVSSASHASMRSKPNWLSTAWPLVSSMRRWHRPFSPESSPGSPRLPCLACCPSLPARHEAWIPATIPGANPGTG